MAMVKVFAIIEDGKVVNRTKAEEALGDNWVESDTARIGQLYDSEADTFSDPEPEPEPVPHRITKGQARRQLIKMGVMPSDVQAIIDQIADATERAIAQSYWDDEQYYLRDHPIMLQIGEEMEFTQEQMDDAFREAVK